MTQELTEERIAEAMARGEGGVPVGNDRCYPIPHRVVDARANCAPKGRCKVGGTRWVIVANSGRGSWDV